MSHIIIIIIIIIIIKNIYKAESTCVCIYKDLWQVISIDIVGVDI